MYRVYLDGALLYDPRVEELQLFDKKLALAVNKSGAFDFTIYPTHPLYDAIDRLKSAIEVYKDDALLFRGRVLDDTIDFYNAKRVICEGDLGFLNDGIIRPYDYSGTITGFMRLVLDEYNAQVNPEKQFSIGTITVTDPNDYIARSSIEADTAWNVINDKLVGLLGGYILVRRENEENFIDYLVDSDRVSTQEITLGENLLGLTKDIKGQDIITALIPYGARIKDEEGNETDERIGIADVNNGLDYVHDADAVGTYGWIFGTATWNDVTVPANLLTKAREALSKNIHAHTGIEVNAVDLSMADVSIDDFRIFEYIKVKSVLHGLDDLMLVSKLDIDLDNPQNNKIFIGMERETLTEKQNNTRNIIKDATRKTKEELVQVIQTAANGKNRIFRGEVEPTEGMMVNDLWYKPVGEGEIEMYQFDGAYWQLIVTTGVNDETIGRIEEAKGIAETARDNTLNIATDLLEGTSFYKHTQNIGLASRRPDGTINSIINLGSDGTAYIAGNNIVLDGNTIVDGTFTVTDEFFAESMNISKFTTGTLNAANVNLINVNVANIVGNISEFIKSYWNTINSQITIDGTKFEGRDTEGNRSVINTSGQFRSESGTDGRYGIFEKGRIWFYNEDASAVLNIGAHPVTGDAGFLKGVLATARAQRLILGRYNDYLTNNINATVNPYISFEYGSTIGDENNVYIKNWKDVSMSGKHINDVQRIEGNELAVRSSQGRLMLGAPQHDGKRYNTLEVGFANTKSNGSIDMGGYTITNQSDIRLKTNVVDSEVNALHEIERMKFIEYDWDLENPANDKKPTGRQFGIVAQYSPFLQTKASGSESYLSVDMSKQVNLNSKAIQELLNRIKALEGTP